MDMHGTVFQRRHDRAELSEIRVRGILKINRDMDIRHAKPADAVRLVRRRLFMIVQAEIDDVANAHCTDIGELRLGRLAGRRYPVIQPVPFVDGFRIGHDYPRQTTCISRPVGTRRPLSANRRMEVSA